MTKLKFYTQTLFYCRIFLYSWWCLIKWSPCTFILPTSVSPQC